ncbi:hypothetical protein D932_00936 [Enterococcus casseliflavus 14-MB-W-14]|nr:hypothetical protein D932_00936 [Enterococcus casseliflavus 14-MB-W-14]
MFFQKKVGFLLVQGNPSENKLLKSMGQPPTYWRIIPARV